MAAPTPTARQIPTGLKLWNGFRTKITFKRYPAVSLWEMSVKPGGLNGGSAINTSTMHNVSRVTKQPQSLVEGGQITGKAAYDPAVRTTIEDMVNVEDTITITYPDGTTESIFGYLMSVEFDELQMGTFPTLSFTVEQTSWDPAADVEAAPAIASVAGT